MSLTKRFISMLLVYGFVISAAVQSSAAISLSRTAGATTEASFAELMFAGAYGFLARLVTPPEDSLSTDEPERVQGLRFRLSEAPDQPEAKPASKVGAAATLSDPETEAILKRLPPIKTDSGDETDFALRDKSLPPPRTGATVLQTFPASRAGTPPEQKSSRALEVIRYSPEGDVPMAPNLSVTFSEAMVAVTSQEEAAQNVPVKLSPEPSGKWHWIGTRTLLFEPEGRFPMATHYSVTVPAGTKSAGGATLMQARSWVFATPPPTIRNFYPDRDSVQRRDVLMFAEFDQRIDPNAVLKYLRVQAAARSLNLRLATSEEVEQNEEVRDLARNAVKDRWIAFRAVDAAAKVENALPAGTSITVSLPPGAPSAEGPQSTQEAQTFSFKTFGPLQLVRSGCGYDLKQPCVPGTSWEIEFNNPIDAVALKESRVRVEPALEGLKLSADRSRVSL